MDIMKRMIFSSVGHAAYIRNIIAIDQTGLVALGPGLDPTIIGPTPGVGPLLDFTWQYYPGYIGEPLQAVLYFLGNKYTVNWVDDDCITVSPMYPCGTGTAFAMPTVYSLSPGILTLSIPGFDETVNFNYHTVTPEPGALVLLGTGCGL